MTTPTMTDTQEKPRVLVVDDEEANLDTFRRVFRRDFAIMTALSVARGLALAEAHEFDVALVDYAMPEANGVDFMQKIARSRPNVARVMLTAHADLDEVKDAYKSGLSQAIIMKPWDRDGVLTRVTNAMRIRSLKRAVDDMHGTVSKK